jgi:hypothetical protein
MTSARVSPNTCATPLLSRSMRRPGRGCTTLTGVSLPSPKMFGLKKFGRSESVTWSNLGVRPL